ncbi:DUF1214 domain-containing protein [Devosia sp.]|uniref:DUF1214 domain-containing protein n=1 Tax=Devosia sp. TaxID=1871048 RepID=UPI002EF01A5C
MRFLGHLLAAIATALVVGFGLSWYALSSASIFGTIEIGPWAAWRDAGSPTPDPYTRAFVSRTGALQLGASEGLQFVATRDSDGQLLDRACRYRIDGTTPLATFWTLVPTDLDGSPIARPGGPAAFHSARIARAQDGSMQLYVSRTLSPYNWLEITGEGSFALALTLYDTASFTGVGPTEATLPSIIREGCP